ncbi:MAG: 30S ribosome-binding factor RbfA [Desulfurella sp.]|jgi:ribosome-binding factor A|uniref:Ribosome-binding factor A n=1 Tax=Desulfurella multipotens TaxID=79269 RepID=A0A1G6LSA0_9BACT|nr:MULTISPECIES: 30S ribosome-binding factor RbfA [Desulfurella]AHF97033.1 ribosome-binding factor A [Desulfurella acetivorans A63]PMP65253.1 MAG: 30S ribosome-binding factor RbfA [Desulfurella multipotens]PMP92918.1 MAG: 30S ribosome-binding factor RbfA [Desulfurella sp.]SDC45635.1 ribosome-binding factor A [Desulfurella multipotens]
MNTKPYKRTQRVSSTLKKIIANVIEFDLNDERLKSVTITDVELSKDFKYAKIYFSCELSEISKKEITNLINKSSGFISRKTCEKIQLRNKPTFRFVYDKSIENGFKIDEILRQIKNE